MEMKRLAWPLGLVLFLAVGSGTHVALAQTIAAPTPSAISYLNPGRYLVFQGTYVNDKGDAESGLVKFDSQTGLTWLLRPAPATNDAGAGFIWVPVKN